MPYLKLQDNRGNTLKSWVLGPQPFAVGRSEDAEARIEDQGVSNRHFQIEEEEGIHYVADQDSTNGTFVNDGRVKRKALEDGDIIRAGKSKFLYEYGVTTMIIDQEQKLGKSIKSELQDLYKQYEE